MKRLRIAAGNGYDIQIERGVLQACGAPIRAVSRAEKVCLISDTNVAPLYSRMVCASLQAQDFEVVSFVFEAGEASKTPQTVLEIVMFLAENGLTREDLVVALGGGVCGDMAGFAAAIYLRGIDYVQLPTSLLAQVDSSVGGKTAVDLPQGKNLCGAFHQPRLVLIDPDVLETLPAEHFAEGMAEAVKMGCIQSKTLFDLIKTENFRDNIEEIIAMCVRLKAQIVERDETEQGERALLNFGHTAGHAIEKLHHFSGVSHGEAVGMGMIIMADAGEKNGLTASGTAAETERVLHKIGLPTRDTHRMEAIIEAMSADKKRSGNKINLIMLHCIGESFIYPVPYEQLPSFFGVTYDDSED